MARWLTLPAVVLAAAACGGAAGRGDDGVERLARRWAAAVDADDPRAAYDLLAAPVKRRKSYEAFARTWRESRVERGRQALGLRTAVERGTRSAEHAALALPDGQRASLTREPGGWRLERPLLAAVRPASPEEAIQRLAEALDQRSFPAVLRLLSSERQEGARELLEALIAGLREHAAELVEVTEDRATLVWSDGSRRWRVVLKREQGAWLVDDFSVQ
jgi:hypothetical protein